MIIWSLQEQRDIATKFMELRAVDFSSTPFTIFKQAMNEALPAYRRRPSLVSIGQVPWLIAYAKRAAAAALTNNQLREQVAALELAVGEANAKLAGPPNLSQLPMADLMGELARRMVGPINDQLLAMDRRLQTLEGLIDSNLAPPATQTVEEVRFKSTEVRETVTTVTKHTLKKHKVLIVGLRKDQIQHVRHRLNGFNVEIEFVDVSGDKSLTVKQVPKECDFAVVIANFTTRSNQQAVTSVYGDRAVAITGCIKAAANEVVRRLQVV